MKATTGTLPFSGEPIVIQVRVTPEIRRAIRRSFADGVSAGERNIYEALRNRPGVITSTAIMEAEDLREKKHTWQGMAIGFIIVFSALLIGAIFTGKSSTANEKRLGDVIAGVRSDVTGLKLATEAAARKVEVPVGGIMEGVASWYGPGFHGRPTASGRIYDMEADTVALPDAKMLGQRVLIYNEDNGRAAIGLCTDLGPFVGSRVVDVSLGVARKLGMEKAGLAWVTVVRLGPENNFR